LPKQCKKEFEKILAEYNNEKEAIIPCLHTARESCGYISEEMVSFLAKKLNLPKVEIYSVASFYSMFGFKEQGKYTIRVCVSLPCYLKGSKLILETLEKELKIKEGESTPDKKFTIEAVSCLGLCDQAPAMMVNEKIYGNLTPEKIKEIIKQYKKED